MSGNWSAKQTATGTAVAPCNVSYVNIDIVWIHWTGNTANASALNVDEPNSPQARKHARMPTHVI